MKKVLFGTLTVIAVLVMAFSLNDRDNGLMEFTDVDTGEVFLAYHINFNFDDGATHGYYTIGNMAEKHDCQFVFDDKGEKIDIINSVTKMTVLADGMSCHCDCCGCGFSRRGTLGFGCVNCACCGRGIISGFSGGPCSCRFCNYLYIPD